MMIAGEGCTLVPALAAGTADAITYHSLPARGRIIGLAWRSSDGRTAEFEQLAELLRAEVGAATRAIEPAATAQV